MKKKLGVLIAALALMCVFAPSAFAATFSPGSWTSTTSLVSSEVASHDYIKITTSGTKMTIQGESTLPAGTLGFNAQYVTPPKGEDQSFIWMGRTSQEDKGGYCSFKTVIDVANLPNGSTKEALPANQSYVLDIERIVPGEGQTTFYKNANFRVQNGKVILLKWDAVIENNAQMLNSASSIDPNKYLDVSLSDLRSQVGTTLTTSQVNFIKDFANDTVGNALSDVDKARKIHDFVAENIYYDDYAFKTGKNQYCNPYTNLYNLKNKVTSANSKGGKVATVCLGEAAITTVLARAEGIPARICNGHHVGLGAGNYQNWGTESGVNDIDHWWAELYIDGQWLVVDPNAGSGNHWKRDSFSDAGTWEHKGLISRVSFLPTAEQFATTYVTYNVFGGKSTGASSGATSSTAKLKAPVPEVTNVAASGKPKITWNAVSGATKYEVWRSTSGKAGTFSRIITTSGTSLTNTSAVAGKTYYYKLRSLGKYASNLSSYSSVVKRACDYAQPKAKGANVAASGKPKITWGGVTNAKKYEVWRSTSGKTGTFSKIFTTTGKALTNTSAVAGKTYYYKVRAIGNANCASAYSSVVKRACDYAQPKVTMGATAKGKPRLTWTSCTGATKYQVYYSTAKNGTYKQLIKTAGKAVNHNSAVKGKTYYYKVRAVGPSASACGAFSPVISKTSK